MLFQIYGETAGFQLLGWLMVFVGLISPMNLHAGQNGAALPASWFCPQV